MTPRHPLTYWMLVGALVVATVGITAAATLLSFLAFQSLAELVGWDPATAWLVQPVVELFVLAGAAEMAMRTWERRTEVLPEALMYAALTVSIAINVSSHVLNNYAEHRVGWQTAVIGAMAALVPLAQVGGVFLLTDRLRALGDRRTVEVTVREEESAGGSDAPGPASDPSAPDSLGDLMSVVAASPGNGHGRTKKARAVAAAVAYHEEHERWPNRDQLAVLADCQPSTARDALALTRKG